MDKKLPGVFANKIDKEFNGKGYATHIINM